MTFKLAAKIEKKSGIFTGKHLLNTKHFYTVCEINFQILNFAPILNVIDDVTLLVISVKL